MKNWKIATTIILYTCLAMAGLLSLSGVLLYLLEQEREEDFTAEYQGELERARNEREAAERKSLQKNVEFNAQILSQIGALPLFNVDKFGLKSILQTYMNYPEILAIQVLDDIQQPFAAIWRSPDITEGDTLPADLALDAAYPIQQESLYEGKPIGLFQIFYTDRLLKQQIQSARTADAEKIEQFRRDSQARRKYNQIRQILGGGVILVALTVCQMVFMRVLIFKRLASVSVLSNNIAHFDLTVMAESPRRDEIGQMFHALNEMIQSLKGVIGQVQQLGFQVTSSSTELAATSKEQEVTLKTQMDAILRMVQSVQEIAEVSAELVNTVQKVAAMSQETAEFASSGQVDLARMQEAMQRMETASTSVSGRLTTINEKADNITNVVTTITKVADQTNLLSLNAAIEAEKAGEYGRGFTVVALEIRRLADQTAVATLDIEQMVKEMQTAVSAGVVEMEKFIAEVRNSTNDVEKISVQLTKIIEQVQTLSPRFEDVHDAIGFQAENAYQLSANMTHLGDEMQQTTTSLKESFAAIEQLNEAARDLQAQVSRFKTD